MLTFSKLTLTPLPPPSKCKLPEEKKSMKKIFFFVFFVVLCLQDFTNLYIEVFIQVSWLKRHSL